MQLSNPQPWKFTLSSILFMFLAPTLVWGASLTPSEFKDLGFFVGGTGTGTRVFRSPNLARNANNMSAKALDDENVDRIGAITVEDDGTTTGGANGIFSGFDVDAIFLDRNGDLSMNDVVNGIPDRINPDFFRFAPGSTRPTNTSSLEPTASRPTFGSEFPPSTGNGVDEGTATLTVLGDADGRIPPNAFGFLSLGDRVDPGLDPNDPFGSNNAQLEASFGPLGVSRGNATNGNTLFLFVGEVGGQPGEVLGATFAVRDVPEIPEPSTALLFITGVFILAVVRLKTNCKA
ncbi:hypothetical protein [Candidatus Nitrospira salsa]|nr:MAG: hypothetical protein NPIRA01_07950 [Nitrospirales bacterium]